MKPLEQELFQVAADSVVIPNRLPLDQWCKENVYLTNPPFKISGQLDLSLSKFLVAPMLALQDPEVRQVIYVGSPRSGKTLIGQGYLLYVINEEPADILLAIHQEKLIKSFSEVRLLPFLKANGISLADDPTDKKKAATQKFIKLPVGSIKICGASAASFTQLGHRVLIGDELHEWKPGMWDLFKRRADDFRYTKKILGISSASDYGTDLHKEFLKGDQSEYGFKCPECNTEQVYHFTYKRPDGQYAGFRFDEVKNARDEWDIPAASATARYECLHCLTKFFDPKDRHVLNECGLYIPQNPNPEKGIRSFRSNAFATDNIPFSEIVSDYLLSKALAERSQYDKARNFHKNILSNFYHHGLTDEKLELTVGEVGQDGKEGLRFLSVDVQKDWLYYVIVAYFKEKKEMWLTTYGKIPKDWKALEKIQLDNRVSYKNVLVDSGDQAQDVYRACANHFNVFTNPKTNKKEKRCWCALKGDEPKEGSYYHPDDKKYRLYSPIRKQEVVNQDKSQKTFCKYAMFAASPCRTILQELIDNKHPQWKLLFSPEAAADIEFKEHLQAEKLTTIFSPRSNKYVERWVNPERLPEHYSDCLKQIVVAGVIVNYL